MRLQTLELIGAQVVYEKQNGRIAKRPSQQSKFGLLNKVVRKIAFYLCPNKKQLKKWDRTMIRVRYRNR